MSEPNRAVRRLTRRVAARPPTREVEVELEGEYVGWWVRARADFPAGLLVDLQSGDMARMLAVLEVVILDHNMPRTDGERAEHIADVDPYDGLLKLAGALFDALGKLPPR